MSSNRALFRGWINAPSTFHPAHSLHGTNVLVDETHPADPTYTVYFLSGPVVSQRVPTGFVAVGWVPAGFKPATPETQEERAFAKALVVELEKDGANEPTA